MFIYHDRPVFHIIEPYSSLDSQAHGQTCYQVQIFGRSTGRMRGKRNFWNLILIIRPKLKIHRENYNEIQNNPNSTTLRKGFHTNASPVIVQINLHLNQVAIWGVALASWKPILVAIIFVIVTTYVIVNLRRKLYDRIKEPEKMAIEKHDESSGKNTGMVALSFGWWHYRL